MKGLCKVNEISVLKAYFRSSSFQEKLQKTKRLRATQAFKYFSIVYVQIKAVLTDVILSKNFVIKCLTQKINFF